MAKYSFEFKMEVVRSYLNCEGGYEYLAKKFNIPSHNNSKNWVLSYQELGEEGLLRKRQNAKYTLKFKLDVVECYLTTEISYQDLALQLGINTPTLITGWVSKFRKYGVEVLSNNQGRPIKMKSKEENIKKNVGKTNTNKSDSEKIKELENQVLALQIENAYLKELRRLRLEKARATKKPQESSTASEDHSN
jgi:transposase